MYILTDVLTDRTIGGLKIESVKEQPTSINMLVYGSPGAGKTVFSGSADAVPEMRPVLLIDVEGGTFSLRNTYPDVDVVRVKTWKDMGEIYGALYEDELDYKTVVLDSLTEIQKFSMYNIMRDLTRKESERDPDVPGLREWGKNIEQTRRLIRAFRDLSSINVIFTALVVFDKDSRTGAIQARPSLSGKLSQEASGFVDFVVYMYTKLVGEDLRRLMLTAGTDRQIAKDRSGQLPELLEDPSMKLIHSYIYNDTKQEKETK